MLKEVSLIYIGKIHIVCFIFVRIYMYNNLRVFLQLLCSLISVNQFSLMFTAYIFCVCVSDKFSTFFLIPVCCIKVHYLFILQIVVSFIYYESREFIRKKIILFCSENLGECIIYMWVEKIRDFIQQKTTQDNGKR